MGSQIVLGMVLLAAGCNQITGVGDLKVAPESCTPANKDSCNLTDEKPLQPPDGAAGSPPEGAGGRGSGGEGGEDPPSGSSTGTIEGIGGTLNLRPPPDSGAAGSGAIPGSGGSPGGGMAGSGMAGSGPPDPPGTSSPCVPGSSRVCPGAGGCSGSQVCLPDASGFGACECPPVGSNARPATVGAKCATDGDCATGLSCTTEADRGGPFSATGVDSGPQNGYCSRLCSTDRECQAIDPLALCLGPEGGPFHCFEGCEPLTASFPGQCNGRDDLACLPLFDAEGRSYCAPACHSDAECAPRFCNLGTGLCQDERPEPVPIGSACAVNEDCNGVCIALGEQPLACSGLCTFGGDGGCGSSATDESPDAACLGTIFGNGLGFGVCSELCDADEDCEQQSSGWGCVPWGLDVLLDYVLRFDRLGSCQFVGTGPTNVPGCSDTCIFAPDGACDDGGPGSSFNVCDLGTDCTDCGAR